MWFSILQFINVVGVASNAFLIAFTSSWGQKYDTEGKLWIVIIFEVSSFTLLNHSPAVTDQVQMYLSFLTPKVLS